jgi:hypothetical protein
MIFKANCLVRKRILFSGSPQQKARDETFSVDRRRWWPEKLGDAQLALSVVLQGTLFTPKRPFHWGSSTTKSSSWLADPHANANLASFIPQSWNAKIDQRNTSNTTHLSVMSFPDFETIRVFLQQLEASYSADATQSEAGSLLAHLVSNPLSSECALTILQNPESFDPNIVSTTLSFLRHAYVQGVQ